MNATKSLPLIAILICLFITAQSSSAAVIPAGTSLTARTVDAISSHERTGRTFAARLDQDAVIQGKVLLRAGTKLSGVVEASRGNPTSRESLKLNITAVSLHGRTLPVKTTGGVYPELKAKRVKQARAGFSVGSSTIPPGTKMQFRLAQPLNI
jgi:hypothetical protein